MEVIDSEVDLVNDIENFGLWLLLLCILWNFRWWLLLLFVYTLCFDVVYLSLGFVVKRRNLIVDVMKNWLRGNRKISGLPINK